MKVCPICRRGPDPQNILTCPEHRREYTEETELPPYISEVDADRVADRLVRKLRTEEDLDRVAEKVVKSFKKDEWEPLAKQVIRRLHIIEDVELIAKACLTQKKF